MILKTINWEANTKKSFNKNYMLSFFNKRKKIFFGNNKKITDLDIKIVRNFRGKFRNMSLKYTLYFGKNEKVIRGKISKYQDTPLREWRVLSWLKKNNLKNISQPLYYYRLLNLFFYRESPGISFEKILSQHKIEKLIMFTPKIVQWLKRLHKIPIKENILPVVTWKEELKERRQWHFLVRKCAPSFYNDYRKLLKKHLELRKRIILSKNIIHGDFHWGNILCQNLNISNKKRLNFTVIDFGSSLYGDSLEDVGGFLAQTDSMFRYYAPNFLDKAEKIKKIFLKEYFSKKINDSEKKRLIYFEISKIFQMISILALTEADGENKSNGITTLLKEAEKKIEMI